MDIMDKADKFFEALEKAGVELGVGQTAIVCNDGVVMVNMDPETESCDVIMCNSKVDFDYNLEITDDDVEAFRNVAGVATELYNMEEDEE